MKLEADLHKYEDYLNDIAIPVASFKHFSTNGVKVMLGHIFVVAITGSLTVTMMLYKLDYEKGCIFHYHFTRKRTSEILRDLFKIHVFMYLTLYSILFLFVRRFRTSYHHQIDNTI